MNITTIRGLRAAAHFPTLSESAFKNSSLIFLQLRYSSSASPALKPSPPRQRIPDINGPLTTLPPPLDLPTRAPDQNLVSHLFATGKAYLTFYKTGIKNIYTNFSLAKDIQNSLNDSNTTLQDAVRTSAISRSSFQLLHRNKHDIKRVPIFALVLLVCGEFTPLVVIAFTAVVPWTCRIPKQIDSDRQKLEKRRWESFRELTSPPPKSARVEKLDKWQLRHINSSLGLSSKLWEWVFGPPEMLLRRRVRQQVEYLEMDDTLIRRSGGVSGLSSEELKMACVERGIHVIGPTDEILRRTLYNWLKSREKLPMESLLLTRPNVWPVRTKTSEPVTL